MGPSLSSRKNDVHFLDMWSAIRSYDDEALMVLLRNRRSEKLKFSIRSCLLHSSIIRGNLGAVRLILESGFDLGKAAKTGFFPVATAAEYSIFSPRLSGVPATSEICKKSVSFEMMSLLLQYGAKLTYSEEPNKSNPLRHIHRLAVQAPDAAGLLFGRMTFEEMNAQCCDPGVSPLAACFLYVCFYYKHSEISETPNLAAVFSYAILPLLRFGANFGPDVFQKAWLSSRLCVAVAELNAYFSQTLWGRPHAVIDLLISTLQRGDFDPSGLNHLTEDLNKNLEARQKMRAFVRYIRSQFPLRLQSMCRIVILRSISETGPKRVESLQKLGLPKPLLDFLMFNEFQLPFM